MNKKGFVKAERERINEVMGKLPPRHRMVWRFVYDNACWTAGVISYKGKKVKVKPGQYLTTTNELWKNLQWKENGRYHRLRRNNFFCILQDLVEGGFLQKESIRGRGGYILLTIPYWKVIRGKNQNEPDEAFEKMVKGYLRWIKNLTLLEESKNKKMVSSKSKKKSILSGENIIQKMVSRRYQFSQENGIKVIPIYGGNSLKNKELAREQELKNNKGEGKSPPEGGHPPLRGCKDFPSPLEERKKKKKEESELARPSPKGPGLARSQNENSPKEEKKGGNDMPPEVENSSHFKILSEEEEKKLSEFRVKFCLLEAKLSVGYPREEIEPRIKSCFEDIKRAYPKLVPFLKSAIEEDFPYIREVLENEFLPPPPPPNSSPSPSEDYERKKARLLREKYEEMLSRLSPENQERCFKSWERREVGEEEWWDIEQRLKEMKLWFFNNQK